MRNSIIVAGVLARRRSGLDTFGQVRIAAFGGVRRSTCREAPTKKLISVRVRPVEPRTQQGAVIVNGRTGGIAQGDHRARQRRSQRSGRRRQHSGGGDIHRPTAHEDRNARLEQTLALVRRRNRASLPRNWPEGFPVGHETSGSAHAIPMRRAQARSMRIDLSAPQSRRLSGGILETRYVEKGGFVKIGDNIAKIVDLDPLLAVGFYHCRARYRFAQSRRSRQSDADRRTVRRRDRPIYRRGSRG